jgi:RimJ/RimL family protein N-acetyltransferase
MGSRNCAAADLAGADIVEAAMPRLTDLSTVRALLDRDREWSAYALGDLSPELVDNCDWHAPADVRANPSLVLLYRGFTPPIAFAIGAGPQVRPLLGELRAPTISLHMQPEAVDAMAGIYTPTETLAMHRMTLRPAAFTPAPHADARPIAADDLGAVLALYDDGHRRGEGPTFFHPAMLGQHTFHGIWEDGALVAIAGTHLYSREIGVCAIGNVYTRSDRRGRGLAASVTSAVAAHALAEGVSTIVLNVSHTNTAARRVYERLGFMVYCEFLEGGARLIKTGGLPSA